MESPKKLTSRQKQVIELLAKGKTNKEIAAELNIAVITAKVHIKTMTDKYNASNRTSLAVMYVKGEIK